MGLSNPSKGYLAATRALIATRMEPSEVRRALPGIVEDWDATVAPSLPAGCQGADFSLSWQTASFFANDSPEEVFNYDFMKNDTRRTPLYYEAIRQRLRDSADPLVMLDLGTGAQALLALEAARAGAKRVYAIEAQATQAALARDAVAAAGFSDVIEVIQGLSTEITLPERVDLLVSETVGSVASEEGLYGTIADAHARHVKRPTDPRSWIPHRCHTMAAPCSYALHYALGPPDYNWRESPRGIGLPGPPRIAAHESSLQLLAEPQSVEVVDFTNPNLPRAGTHELTAGGPVRFEIDAERLRQGEAELYEATQDPALEANSEVSAETRADAATFAALASRSFSGVALWPRLELDPGATIVVEARGKHGQARESSWSCLLPLIGDRPLSVEPGDTVAVEMAVELAGDVERPPAYKIQGRWTRRGI